MSSWRKLRHPSLPKQLAAKLGLLSFLMGPMLFMGNMDKNKPPDKAVFQWKKSATKINKRACCRIAIGKIWLAEMSKEKFKFLQKTNGATAPRGGK